MNGMAAAVVILNGGTDTTGSPCVLKRNMLSYFMKKRSSLRDNPSTSRRFGPQPKPTLSTRDVPATHTHTR